MFVVVIKIYPLSYIQYFINIVLCLLLSYILVFEKRMPKPVERPITRSQRVFDCAYKIFMVKKALYGS